MAPYNSNEAMLTELPDDLEIIMFGSNCRSIAENELKRGPEAADDWAAFDRVVRYLKESFITQFVYEQVCATVGDPLCADRRAHPCPVGIRGRWLRAVKYGVVHPCHFCCAVLIPRALFLVLKEEAVVLVGFLDQPVITSEPLGSHRASSKYIAGHLGQPILETNDPDVIELEAWKEERAAASREAWEIRWFDRQNTKHRRDAIPIRGHPWDSDNRSHWATQQSCRTLDTR